MARAAPSARCCRRCRKKLRSRASPGANEASTGEQSRHQTHAHRPHPTQSPLPTQRRTEQSSTDEASLTKPSRVAECTAISPDERYDPRMQEYTRPATEDTVHSTSHNRGTNRLDDYIP